MIHGNVRLIAMALLLAATAPAFAGDGGTWSVSKSSGEVWISSGDVQQTSLNADDSLKPGDFIRTGRNGRVLLVRGEEHILIAPNSVVGMPSQPTEGLSTTIVQKAGSILLDVEKRNVKHFEVETPYLAAVVKGTQFRVSVNATSTSVNVIRGQVEVADFKSGQIAQVMPGQKAIAFEHGKPGLSLSGAGSFNPIEQGKPRSSSVNRIPVPKGGLLAPRSAATGHAIRTLAAIDHSAGKHATASAAQRHIAGAPHNGLRISSPIGEVKLNVHKATHGLARGTATAVNGAGRNAANSTIWNSSGSSSATPMGASSNSANMDSTTPTSNSPATNTSSSNSAGRAAVAAGGNDGNGNGNGANGNGRGNGRAGAPGNGPGNGPGNAGGPGNGPGHGQGSGPGNRPGNGNGNNGNGNGNGNNGNGLGNNGNGNNGNGNSGNNGNGNGNSGNGNGNANAHGKK